MLNYLVFGIAIIIFATVIIISGKAISRGIEAKQNLKDKPEDEKNSSFCGRKTVEKFSYCPLHLMVVFQPKGKKDDVVE